MKFLDKCMVVLAIFGLVALIAYTFVLAYNQEQFKKRCELLGGTHISSRVVGDRCIKPNSYIEVHP